MVLTYFDGAGIGFGFGVGCGFGVGWGFGGGGCGVGLGLGWGFGAAFGSQYRSSRVTFQGTEFVRKDKNDRKEVKDIRESTQKVRASQ